ncbi:MAG: alpha/beta fold hydrolase [Caulobacteraceae bacterium]
MPMLNRNGVELHYEVHGEGTPMLLTHGYSSSSHMWEGQIAPFSKTCKVITWDMRGHGRSDYPEAQSAYTEAETVADMAAILEAVGAEKAVIGGLSLGGYMSLAFNLVHPDKTLALLIIDTGPGYKSDKPREDWNVAAIKRAERFEEDGLPQGGAGGVETRAAPHRDASGLAKAARGMLTQHDARVISSLPSIQVSSLVVVGADDTPFLVASEYMAAKIPGARSVVIANAGHAANIDQPDAFNRAVLDFLADVAPAGVG